VINSLDPCFCKTGLGADMTGALRVFMKIFQTLTARTAEEGSRLVVQSAGAGRETHGKYMRSGKVRAYLPIASDEKKGDAVWDALCKRLEGLQPGVLKSLSEN
jgi:retinol dehydrogenase 12